ncbi:uncharacterized protein CXorf65 homolog [Liolophura sinensis]|uniref:uncharacterized protein CXorf65 homolog n=1 Tax=Liolophura sinensis TaxID=3198878 RepID=UPI00315810BE
MFVKLLYGDEESVLLNPDCSIINFMQYVRERCDFDNKGLLAFCNDSGQVIMVSEKQTMETLAGSMEHRESYVPLELERNSSNKITKAIPLLKNYEKHFPSLEQKLKTLVTDSPEKTRKRSPVTGEKNVKRKDADKSRMRLDKESPTISTDSVVKKSVSRLSKKQRKKASD